MKFYPKITYIAQLLDKEKIFYFVKQKKIFHLDDGITKKNSQKK